jgi:hypothetical protein
VAGRIDPEHAALVTRPLAAIERGHLPKDSQAFGGELSISASSCTAEGRRAAQDLQRPGITPDSQQNRTLGRWIWQIFSTDGGALLNDHLDT